MRIIDLGAATKAVISSRPPMPRSCATASAGTSMVAPGCTPEFGQVRLSISKACAIAPLANAAPAARNLRAARREDPALAARRWRAARNPMTIRLHGRCAPIGDGRDGVGDAVLGALDHRRRQVLVAQAAAAYSRQLSVSCAMSGQPPISRHNNPRGARNPRFCSARCRPFDAGRRLAIRPDGDARPHLRGVEIRRAPGRVPSQHRRVRPGRSHPAARGGRRQQRRREPRCRLRLHLAARAIRNDKNVGFAAACNQGARSSRADLLVFFNPDVGSTDPTLARSCREPFDRGRRRDRRHPSGRRGWTDRCAVARGCRRRCACWRRWRARPHPRSLAPASFYDRLGPCARIATCRR